MKNLRYLAAVTLLGLTMASCFSSGTSLNHARAAMPLTGKGAPSTARTAQKEVRTAGKRDSRFPSAPVNEKVRVLVTAVTAVPTALAFMLLVIVTGYHDC
jgi:hypothetical protein